MTLLRRAQKRYGRFQNPVPTSLGGPGMFFRVLPLLLKNRAERTPRLPLGPFRTDASVYSVPPVSGLRITWFGHSSTLVELDGVRVLIDPVWDRRASPLSWAGPVRFFTPTLPLAEFPKLDAVLISHDHYDHLGANTVRALARLQPEARWITSLEVGGILVRLGVRREQISELDWTETVGVGSGAERCRITSLPARHFSGRGATSRLRTLWASFVLRGPVHSVYYGADSGPWPGYEEIGRDFGPFDVTMLEIGAYHPLWGDIHLGPENALRAYEALGGAERAGLLMPIHWGLFNLALHAWGQPIEQVTELAEAQGVALWSPAPGEPVEVRPTQPFLSYWWR